MVKRKEPKTDLPEFNRFLDRMQEAFAPEEIILISLAAESKTPTSKILWERQPLSTETARNLERLGTNVGFVALENTSVVLIDDDSGEIGEMPPTFTIRSRMRTHKHYIYKTIDPRCKVNINTPLGGIRSCTQYIVAPGSFVVVSPTEKKLIPLEEQPLAGRYTIADDLPVAEVTYDDLPPQFQKALEDKQRKMLIAADRLKARAIEMENDDHRKGKSALNYLTFFDILPALMPLKDIQLKKRFDCPGLHETASTTGGNTSISLDGKLLTCWRCNAVINPYVYLAILAGIGDCETLGAPMGTHKMGLDSSILTDEQKCLIWQKARELDLLPEDDAIPVAITKYIALKEGLCQQSDISSETGMVPLNVLFMIKQLVKDGLY